MFNQTDYANNANENMYSYTCNRGLRACSALNAYIRNRGLGAYS